MAKQEGYSTAIELALMQAKKVEREIRILKQQLARLRDNDLQSQETQGNGRENSN